MLRRTLILVLFVLLLSMGWMACRSYMYWRAYPNRPVFGGTYSAKEWIGEWTPCSPLDDQSNHQAFYDGKLNLLVIVTVSEEDFCMVDKARSTTKEGVLVTARSSKALRIAAESNVLLLAHPDGIRERIPLETHAAEDLYLRIQRENPKDMLPLVLRQVKREPSTRQKDKSHGDGLDKRE